MIGSGETYDARRKFVVAKDRDDRCRRDLRRLAEIHVTIFEVHADLVRHRALHAGADGPAKTILVDRAKPARESDTALAAKVGLDVAKGKTAGAIRHVSVKAITGAQTHRPVIVHSCR